MKFFYCLIIISISFSCSYSQQNDQLLNEIEAKLAKGQTTLSDVLSDTRYMHLHTQIHFREIIKKYAKPGKINIVTDNEPGKKITVRGIITTTDGKPLNAALVYVYQTSDKGWYGDAVAHIPGNGGDTQHARLFGYLKTDNKGQFEYSTVQPRGYPDSDLPAHIHISVWKDGQLVSGIPGELLFDDDPRLTPGRRSRSLGDGFLIEKNSGTTEKPVYFYKIKIAQ